MAQKSLKRSFFSVALSKYINIIIGVAFSAVMARLLTPEDYGIFAVVNVIDAFLLTASEFGIGSGVIQNMDLTDKELDGIFTFTGWIGVAFGILIAVLGIPLSIYYNDSAYLVICPMMFLSNLFFALNVTPNAVMLRQGSYDAIAVRNVVVSVGSLFVGLAMAYMGFQYYSLVIRMIVMYAAAFIWNEATIKLRFIRSIKKSAASVKKIAVYSLYRFLGDVAYYGELNLDNFVIGGCLGSTSLGYYDKAYRLLDYPVGNLAGVLNSVLHPMLKDYQNRTDVMLQKYLGIQRIFSLISIVIVTLCFTCNREMIYLLYGNQWENAVMTFAVMSIAIYPKMLLSTMNSVFSSLGDTRLLFLTQLKRTVVVLACVLIGVSSGKIEAVAVGIVVSSWVNFFLTSDVLIRKGFKVQKRGIAKNYVSDIIFMAGVTIIASWFFRIVFPQMGNFAALLIKGICIAVIYMAYYFIGGGMKVLAILFPDKIKNKIFRQGE